MPFTISHVAAVMPLSRLLARWRLLSATVIGAMVPDFHIFFPWRLSRAETHSALALFTWCFPVGLLTYWLFQFLIKRPMLELLPSSAYGRWQADIATKDLLSPLQWLLAVVGIMVGAVSHDVWDAFTHEGARGVRLLEFLDEPLFDNKLHRLIVTRLAQDLSSVLGLIVVIALVFFGLRHRDADAAAENPARPIEHRERVIWVVSYFLCSMALSVPIFLMMRLGEPSHWAVFIINDMAIASLRGLAIALLLFSIALRVRLFQRSRP